MFVKHAIVCNSCSNPFLGPTITKQ